MATQVRRPRVESPERWQKALERAVAGNVQVRQLRGSGQWVATSSSDPTIAYELDVTGNVVHGCTCPAAEHADPVCAHRAMAWYLIGALDLPEPTPVPEPAPVTETVRCPDCGGDGFIKIMTGGRFSDWVPGTCHRCASTGEVTITIETLAA